MLKKNDVIRFFALVGEMYKMKNKVIEYMKNKDRVHLKQIYADLDLNKNSVRAIINSSILKKESIFERLGEGYYKLVDDVLE